LATFDPMYLELSFEPNVELVSVIRRFVASVHQRLKVDRDLAARVALAVHEMLENAIKYATGGRTRLRVEVKRDGELDSIAIRTWNRAVGPHRQSLTTGLDDLRRAEDPFAYYQTLMIATAKRDDGSGLGLARIRAEAEMELSYELCDDETVCVVARNHPGRSQE
jgi:two-component sensor histidine kinase